MIRLFSKRHTRHALRKRKPNVERLECRNLMTAAPLGATEFDTAEFFLGRVAVTPVFFESTGATDQNTQDWTPAEIDEVLNKIAEGLRWWSDTLDTFDSVHSLEFVIDDTYARNPVDTPYELIDRTSEGYELAAGDFLESLGYPGKSSLQNSVQAFNNDQRDKPGIEADWAFTIFVVDSSDDGDGLFAPGGFFSGAFAFSGGLFMVVPSSRPVSTFTHETGHIFWAFDEYPGGASWAERRGYYNTQNLNAANNPTNGFEQEISIMRGGSPLNEAFDNHVSPESTLALIGWRDSDGDGVFDVADVPLKLQGIGYFDSDSSTYRFKGDAAAVPLWNQNSEGPQSDITLNRISEIQYRLDDGDWVTAFEPDEQKTQFDLEVELSEGFSKIDWLAIDSRTRITSPIVSGSLSKPAISSASVSGFAYLSSDEDTIRSASESLFAGIHATIRNADGSELFRGEVHAADLPDGKIANSEISNVALTTNGFSIDRQLGVSLSTVVSGKKVFQSYNAQILVWSERWNKENGFVAKFDENVGEVNLSILGVDATSYGRIEAYDAQGQMLGRVTSEKLSSGESATLSISDARGRIAEIRAFGHAGTSVAISDIRFGNQDQFTTDGSGAIIINNLPDGNYTLELVAPKLIFAFDEPMVPIAISNGTSEPIVAIARQVSSPRHNAKLAGDVNDDGVVTANDALIVINDLNVNLPRLMGANETIGALVDVNNDGAATALDALMVINSLNGDSGEGERVAEPHSPKITVDKPTALFSSSIASSHDAVFADWSKLSDEIWLSKREFDERNRNEVQNDAQNSPKATVLLPDLTLAQEKSEKFSEKIVVN